MNARLSSCLWATLALSALLWGCPAQRAAGPTTTAPGVGVSASEPAEEAFVLADRYVYVGDEGGEGVELVAKFKTREALIAHFDLKREIGALGGKPWALRDVLIDLDLNANGEVASWTVAGPKPLIDAYVEATKASPDIYDFSEDPLDTTSTGALEGDEHTEEGEEGEPDDAQPAPAAPAPATPAPATPAPATPATPDAPK